MCDLITPCISDLITNQIQSFFVCNHLALKTITRKVVLIIESKNRKLCIFCTFSFSGLVLQDLTFVHIGNSDLLSEDVINFSKRWQQFNIVENMKRFKKG